MTQRTITGESTRRLRWIVTLQGGLDALLRHRSDTLVAGSVPWYVTPGSTSSASPAANARRTASGKSTM